jgi:hypothetical protein
MISKLRNKTIQKRFDLFSNFSDHKQIIRFGPEIRSLKGECFYLIQKLNDQSKTFQLGPEIT